MTPRGVLDYGFMLDGIAPSGDMLWHLAGAKGQAAFWRQAARVGVGVFQLQMSAGLDRLGRAFIALKQSTIDRRRSAMTNHPDPYAPPFIPAHELSRTVSYLRAKVMPRGVWFYWLMDAGLKRRWGQVLDWHRRGMVRGAPVRDVFGFAPESIARIKKEMSDWWAKNRANVATEAADVAVQPGSNLILEVGGPPRAPVPIPFRPKPPIPPATSRYVPLHGVTHIDRMAGAIGDGPQMVNGEYVGILHKRRVNDVSKLRNAPIPPKRGRPRPILGGMPPAAPPTAHREFEGKQGINDWTAKAFEGYAAKLKPGETAELDSYSSGGFSKVNGFLRSSRYINPGEKPSLRRRVAALDSAIAKGVIPDPVIVWRGIDPKAMGIVDPAKLAGTIISDKGFLSTSLSRDVAERAVFGGKTIMRLRVPAGSRAASITASVGWDGEHELILPRNGRIRVVRVTTEGETTVIEGEWAP